jgi:hypothetical protein
VDAKWTGSLLDRVKHSWNHSIKNIEEMRKIGIFIFLCFSSVAAYSASTNELLSPTQYNMMEPYLNNKMRQKLQPADSRYTTSTNQRIRRVVARSAVAGPSGVSSDRSAVYQSRGTNASSGRRVVARSAVSGGASVRGASSTRGVVNRGVVARSTDSRPTSYDQNYVDTSTSASNTLLGNGEMTTAQCLSNYSDCMDDYCHRANTKYDRCYCSPKLAALDAEYKPQIDALVKKIAILQNGGEIEDGMSQEEINALWQQLFGATGENSMQDLDAALDIDWAGTDNSVRGQNAFISGDSFCKQQLSNCFYMSENLKSMYRTSIGQDCAAYEKNLKKLKTAAESIVASYDK